MITQSIIMAYISFQEKHFARRNSAVEDVPRCAQMSKRHFPKRFFLFVVAREFQRKSMNTSLFETFVGCGLRSCKLQRSVTLQLHVDSDSQTCGHQHMAVHLHDNVNSIQTSSAMRLGNASCCLLDSMLFTRWFSQLQTLQQPSRNHIRPHHGALDLHCCICNPALLERTSLVSIVLQSLIRLIAASSSQYADRV